jgi:hypothetical protein
MQIFLYNIKIKVEETEYKSVDWIHVAQETAKCRDLVDTEMKLCVL